MIVGDSFRIPFRYRAESRVRRAVRNRIGASPSWERAEAPCVCVRVLNQFMNSMMAEVSDAERSTRVKCLLQLQAPSLVLWRARSLLGGRYSRRKEVRNRGLDLRERLPRRKSVNEC